MELNKYPDMVITTDTHLKENILMNGKMVKVEPEEHHSLLSLDCNNVILSRLKPGKEPKPWIEDSFCRNALPDQNALPGCNTLLDPKNSFPKIATTDCMVLTMGILYGAPTSRIRAFKREHSRRPDVIWEEETYHHRRKLYSYWRSSCLRKIN